MHILYTSAPLQSHKFSNISYYFWVLPMIIFYGILSDLILIIFIVISYTTILSIEFVKTCRIGVLGVAKSFLESSDPHCLRGTRSKIAV